MTKEEIIARMNKIDEARFFLAMKDHWDASDFTYDDKLFSEWLTLKAELDKIEK